MQRCKASSLTTQIRSCDRHRFSDPDVTACHQPTPMPGLAAAVRSEGRPAGMCRPGRSQTDTTPKTLFDRVGECGLGRSRGAGYPNCSVI